MSWLFVMIALTGLAGVVAQGYLAWTATHAGKPPEDAFWMSQQRVWSVFLNPWIFAAYLLLLALLLWSTIRETARKGWKTINL